MKPFKLAYFLVFLFLIQCSQKTELDSFQVDDPVGTQTLQDNLITGGFETSFREEVSLEDVPNELHDMITANGKYPADEITISLISVSKVSDPDAVLEIIGNHMETQGYGEVVPTFESTINGRSLNPCWECEVGPFYMSGDCECWNTTCYNNCNGQFHFYTTCWCP